MEASYGRLESAEKNRSGDRRQKWSDDEFSIVLLAIYRNMDGKKLLEYWPQDDFPRSPAVIKKKLVEVKHELKQALQIEPVLTPNPELDGVNAAQLLQPLLLSLGEGMAVFGYPIAHFSEVLAGVRVDHSGARFRLTRLPFQSDLAITTNISAKFVSYDFPPGYRYVRKYDNPELDVIPIKGFLLKCEIDEKLVGEEEEMEMF